MSIQKTSQNGQSSSRTSSNRGNQRQQRPEGSSVPDSSGSRGRPEKDPQDRGRQNKDHELHRKTKSTDASTRGGRDDE